MRSQDRRPVLFLDQLVTRLPGEGGEMPLSVADKVLDPPLRKHVVALRALFGDDRFRDGAGTRRVTARSGLYQRNEEVAPRHDSYPRVPCLSGSERILAHGMRAGAERPPRKAASGA